MDQTVSTENFPKLYDVYIAFYQQVDQTMVPRLLFLRYSPINKFYLGIGEFSHVRSSGCPKGTHVRGSTCANVRKSEGPCVRRSGCRWHWDLNTSAPTKSAPATSAPSAFLRGHRTLVKTLRAP